ncbi:hypothetical protein [Pseudarthrobacter sp. TAF60_1]|uniref:hypothetical protein n=1 Tax=Pseudarthrobacter sp. TAF60_1 TaxID=3233071 RepID=UPI003F9EAF36
MTTFTERLEAATDTRDPRDYVRRVKTVVADELRSADPSIKLLDTGYYAHSAIPDFEAIWAHSQTKRPIFLRDGLADVVAAHDMTFLPSTHPAVLTLDTAQVPVELIAEAETESASKPEGLIAIGTSFNSEVLSSEAPSPLAKLVRTNFVKGARGLITPDTLDDFDDQNDEPASDDVRRQMDIISSHFDGRIAFRIKALSGLIALSEMGEEEFAEKQQEIDMLAGELDPEELEWLLPALLLSDNRPTAQFWGRFGTLFDLRDLERMSAPLQGFDLTDLVEANKDSWSARRAYSGLWITDDSPATDSRDGAGMDDQQQLDGVPAKSVPAESWSFVGTVLSKRLPESARRIAVAWDAHKLKRAPAQSSKSWDQARELIADQTLLQVDLHGIQRSVSVNAVQSTDIRADITDVTTSVEDSYLVSSVALGLKNTEDEVVRVDVDFGGSMISAALDVRLSDLVETATTVFDSRAVLADEAAD